MRNKIQHAFDDIHAEESLKESTKAFLLTKIQEKAPASARIKYAVVLAGLFFLILGLGGYFSYFTQVATISIDVNPSIEMGINLFNKVVSVKEFNDDAAVVLEDVNVKYKDYDDAIEELMSSKSFSRFLKENALLTFTVVSKEAEKEEEIISTVQKHQGTQHKNIQCYKGNQAYTQAAHDSGLSVGKYRAYLELLSYDSTVDIEEIKGLSMRQIQDRINVYTQGEGQDDTETTQKQGDKHGNGQGEASSGCNEQQNNNSSKTGKHYGKPAKKD